jgi:hypothetical protein
MKTFKHYLEERQMKLFSTNPVELYHATNTGADDGVLQSFKSKGITPRSSTGWGQGSGFYVFSDKNTAIKHSASIKDDSITTNAQQDGHPMVVTVQEIVDPEKWDLDYELNSKSIINWLHDNFDKAQSLLSDDSDGVQLNRKRTGSVLDAQDQTVMSKGIQTKLGGKRSMMYSQGASSLARGETLSQIMNKLQEKDPAMIHRFEELLFANMPSGFALKYVGNEPLKPKSIEVYKDGNWKSV